MLEAASLAPVTEEYHSAWDRMRRARATGITCLLHLVLMAHLVQSRNEYTKLFDRCSREKNAFDCLKQRALEILDTAIKDDSVYVINDYVSIARDTAAAAGGTDRSFNDSNETELSLDQKLDNKFHEYLASRSFKLTIPGDTFQGMEHCIRLDLRRKIFRDLLKI